MSTGESSNGLPQPSHHAVVLTQTVAANSFVALEAPYDFVKPASFITTPVIVPDDCPAVAGNASGGVRLLVNVITSAAGHIAVGVQPADGKPPPTAGPFELQHANRIKGNAIAAVASWSAADDRMATLEAWKGRSVRLHVEMVDARLFSLRMACGGETKPIKSDDVSEAPQAHWRNDVANLRLVKAWDDYLAQTPLTRERSGPVSDFPPVSLNWSVGRTDIPVGLKNGVACRFGDQIVIAGGLAYNTSAPNGTNRAWPWALVYNTELGTWTPLEPAPPFTAGRTQGACSAEAMYIVSGASGWANSDVGVPKSAAPNPIYANVLRLTRAQAGSWQWTPLPPLPISDGGLALGVAGVVDEEWLVVVGGQLITKAGEKLDKSAPGFRLRLRSDGELLSPAAMGNWSLIAPHPLARTTAAAVRIPIGGALGRSFFYFGGMATDVNRTKAYAEFNRRQICEGFMTECPLLLGPWAGHSDDHGLFMPRDAFRYDVDSDTWHTIADLPHPMHGGAQHAVAIDDRHLLLMGTSHDMSFRVGRSGFPAVTEVWTHSSPDKTAKYYNDDIVCYDRVTDTYARVGKLLYGVGTASWVLAPVSGPSGQLKLYGFGGEPMHGFNQNSETVVQVATVLNRTTLTTASKSDDSQGDAPPATLLGKDRIPVLHPKHLPSSLTVLDRTPLGMLGDFKPDIVVCKNGDLLVMAATCAGGLSGLDPPGFNGSDPHAGYCQDNWPRNAVFRSTGALPALNPLVRVVSLWFERRPREFLV